MGQGDPGCRHQGGVTGPAYAPLVRQHDAGGRLTLWGPWSIPSELLSKDEDVGCRLVMIPTGCGNRRDFWPGSQKSDKLVTGSFYAPFVLNRYTTPAAGNGQDHRATIYWLVSTWNPYEVTVMRATLKRD
jgi:hypothetical protein